MIHLFVNALAASAGGGLTYVRNIVPHMSARSDVRATLLVGAELREELKPTSNVDVISEPSRLGVVGRYWFEQRSVASLVRSSGANVLLSACNFALHLSPVPQILLSRNALYICDDFYNDLRRRRAYRLWLDTRVKAWLARRSVETADVTVAPSRAFAEELRQWTGKNVVAIHHGFDSTAFLADSGAPRSSAGDKLGSAHRGARLLFVSHYNYYRNFETLIRAIGRAVRKPGGQQLQLVLTCKLRSEENPGSYHAEGAARLVAELGLAANIVELGSVPYSQLHHVYRSCDIYVTPAYCESFAHPLVEAMSCGLPIIASDLPVHREICEQAAVYFQRFSDEELFEWILQLVESPELRNKLGSMGRARAAAFSWRQHVDQIVTLAEGLVGE